MSDPSYPAGPGGPTGSYPPPSGGQPPAGEPPTGGPPPPSTPPPAYGPPVSSPQPYSPPSVPQYGFAYGAPPVIVKTNGMAIASMISGIAGMLLCVLFVPSILAVIFGHVALAQIKRSGGHEQGRGMAISGLILGYLAIVAAIVWIIVVVVNSDSTTTY